MTDNFTQFYTIPTQLTWHPIGTQSTQILKGQLDGHPGNIIAAAKYDNFILIIIDQIFRLGWGPVIFQISCILILEEGFFRVVFFLFHA